MSLDGRRALVTGATSGIGQVTAQALAREGATVIVTGRDEQRGRAVVEQIRASGGSAELITADLATSEGVDAVLQQAGEVDVLVNNAGVFPGGPTEDLPGSAFDEAFAVNVKAPFFLTAALAPKMAANGGGAIVNVTTMVAEFGMPGLSAYGASKAAVALLTKVWAAEYAARGVRVNAVSPGPTRTANAESMGDGFNQIVSTIPAGRAAEPQEIADAIVFLASDRASYINGAVLPVDGGRLAV
ncbi:MAG TPA: SDR family NAD(P)-dependent oxidoreductase [Solirubrobacteraceae bacterium]|jgi:NAD(P)-dependent dehydrogenase (short-subunit alcohol dehydrogenase family)|nr:SDR family NAD(P)-dependent oxidoreductase [Solirubrobacteraceae bacterium]